MRNINEDKPVIAREPGKGGKGKLGAVLLGPDGKPIPGSWRSIEDLTAEKKNPPQANIDYFLKLERERNQSQPPAAPAVPPTTLKPDSGKGLSPAPSKPGTPERNKLEAEIEAANKARREAEAAKPAEPKPVPVKSTRQQELDKINVDKTLTPMQKWEKANPGLAAVRKEREAIRGTSETDNPLMQGLRSGLPAARTALDTTAFKADLAKSGIKPSAYSSLLNNPRRMKYQQPSVEKEAYDVVLDYLLSEGHAETVEEAHYVMMQLDSEYIQSIVEDSAPIPNIPTPTPTEKPKDKKKPPADTKIPDGSGYGPEEGGVFDREVRVPPNSYGDLRFPPNQRFNRGLGGPPPNTNTRPNTDPTTNTKPKPRKPLISLYPGQKGDGLMGPYIQFGNTRLGIPNISPFRPDK